MPDYILAIDTTSERGSLALWGRLQPEDQFQSVLGEVQLRSPDGFAHVLFGEISELLARHGIGIGDIACFAAASGPGTFTGVRVGLTAAKGLAEATGRRVVAVSNLQALASFGTKALRAPMIDARRGQIFGAVYDANLNLVQDEIVTAFDSWVTTLPEGAEIIRPDIAANGLASAIARIAAEKYARGLARDPAEIDANYVRRSDAELMWRDPK